MTSLAVATAAAAFAQEAQEGSTKIARWKGNAKGATLLYYDDGTTSSLKFAVPALNEHGVDGTFFLVPGSLEKDPQKFDAWIDAAKSPNIHVGNHTWSHKGAKSLEEMESEIAKADEVLRKRLSYPKDKLMAFAHPGGVPWDFTQEQQSEVGAKYALLSRLRGPRDIAGPSSNIKNAQDAIAMLDLAEKTGDLTTILFHGVGGDWFNFPPADHETLVREIAKRKEEGRIWAPSAIDALKYVAERDGASITDAYSGRSVAHATAGKTFAFNLNVTTDSTRYDVPLTLVTQVPADWKSATVRQWQNTFKVPVNQGALTYDVKPIASRILILKDNDPAGN
ncbi:MAG: polysaccharide deacetylase family protein [Kiritimatiellia bacterium]